MIVSAAKLWHCLLSSVSIEAEPSGWMSAAGTAADVAAKDGGIGCVGSLVAGWIASVDGDNVSETGRTNWVGSVARPIPAVIGRTGASPVTECLAVNNCCMTRVCAVCRSCRDGKLEQKRAPDDEAEPGLEFAWRSIKGDWGDVSRK